MNLLILISVWLAVSLIAALIHKWFDVRAMRKENADVLAPAGEKTPTKTQDV